MGLYLRIAARFSFPRRGATIAQHSNLAEKRS